MGSDRSETPRAAARHLGHCGRSLSPGPRGSSTISTASTTHGVAVDAPAEHALEDLREEAAEAAAAIRRSRATEAEPLTEVAARLGGELQPFQWAGVRYVLDARRVFLSDEQGLGKTVKRWPRWRPTMPTRQSSSAPRLLKLNWLRETRKWLPHRSVAIVEGGVAVPKTAEITIINYEVVGKHHETLARLRAKAVIVDEVAHYGKNPRAKRTQAVRRLSRSVAKGGLRVAR